MRPHSLLMAFLLLPFISQAQEISRTGPPFMENCPRTFSVNVSDTIVIKYAWTSCRSTSFRYIKVWEEGDVMKAAWGYIYGRSPVFKARVRTVEDWKNMNFPSPLFGEVTVSRGWTDSLLLAYDYILPLDSAGADEYFYGGYMLSAGEQHYLLSEEGQDLMDDLTYGVYEQEEEDPGIRCVHSYYEPLSSLDVLKPVWENRGAHKMFFAFSYSLVWMEWYYQNDSLMADIMSIGGLPSEWTDLGVEGWIEVLDTADFEGEYHTVYMGPEFLPMLEEIRRHNIAPVYYDAPAKWDETDMISLYGARRVGYAGVDWSPEILSGYQELLLNRIAEIQAEYPPVPFMDLYPESDYTIRKFRPCTVRRPSF